MNGDGCRLLGRKRWTTILALGTLATLLATEISPDPLLAGCVGSLPQNWLFTSEAVVRWDLSPSGLIAVYHCEAGHPPDHLTLHRILFQGFDTLSEEKLRQSFGPLVSIVQSEELGSGPPYYYIYLTNALYYGKKLDASGFATDLWEDQEEDGLNGNECRVSSRVE